MHPWPSRWTANPLSPSSARIFFFFLGGVHKGLSTAGKAGPHPCIRFLVMCLYNFAPFLLQIDTIQRLATLRKRLTNIYGESRGTPALANDGHTHTLGDPPHGRPEADAWAPAPLASCRRLDAWACAPGSGALLQVACC